MISVDEIPFLSTLSLRRATIILADTMLYAQFLSTLSLRRATSRIISSSIITTYFYPRSPCGERHQTDAGGDKGCEFLSTLSLRRATKIADHIDLHSHISIHALLAESDGVNKIDTIRITRFLSTLSLRRATCLYWLSLIALPFLSTLSLRRATLQREIFYAA